MDNDNGNIPVFSERQLALFQCVKDALDDLPVLHASSVPKDESCAICLTPFNSILDGEVSQEGDAEDGVTKVVGCGHLFCRKDLSEWIRNFHGSCPTCRHPFLDLKPYTESDAESSDGDYIPEDDEDEEEDDFLGLPEFDEDIEVDMEVDFDDIWGYDEDEDYVGELPEPDIEGLPSETDDGAPYDSPASHDKDL